MLSFAIGLAGIFLPLVPTVPLILLAAVCFANSSEAAHNWLINHRNFGVMIQDWRDRGAISRNAKRAASISIALAFAISLYLQIPMLALIAQGIVLLGALGFIWTRPSG
jgi:uncharacterized membrane protein YbaN (DUF454 family)